MPPPLRCAAPIAPTTPSPATVTTRSSTKSKQQKHQPRHIITKSSSKTNKNTSKQQKSNHQHQKQQQQPPHNHHHQQQQRQQQPKRTAMSTKTTSATSRPKRRRPPQPLTVSSAFAETNLPKTCRDFWQWPVTSWFVGHAHQSDTQLISGSSTMNSLVPQLPSTSSISKSASPLHYRLQWLCQDADALIDRTAQPSPSALNPYTIAPTKDVNTCMRLCPFLNPDISVGAAHSTTKTPKRGRRRSSKKSSATTPTTGTKTSNLSTTPTTPKISNSIIHHPPPLSLNHEIKRRRLSKHDFSPTYATDHQSNDTIKSDQNECNNNMTQHNELQQQQHSMDHHSLHVNMDGVNNINENDMNIKVKCENENSFIRPPLDHHGRPQLYNNLCDPLLLHPAFDENNPIGAYLKRAPSQHPASSKPESITPLPSPHFRTTQELDQRQQQSSNYDHPLLQYNDPCNQHLISNSTTIVPMKSDNAIKVKDKEDVKEEVKEIKLTLPLTPPKPFLRASSSQRDEIQNGYNNYSKNFDQQSLFKVQIKSGIDTGSTINQSKPVEQQVMPICLEFVGEKEQRLIARLNYSFVRSQPPSTQRQHNIHDYVKNEGNNDCIKNSSSTVEKKNTELDSTIDSKEISGRFFVEDLGLGFRTLPEMRDRRSMKDNKNRDDKERILIDDFDDMDKCDELGCAIEKGMSRIMKMREETKEIREIAKRAIDDAVKEQNNIDELMVEEKRIMDRLAEIGRERNAEARRAKAAEAKAKSVRERRSSARTRLTRKKRGITSCGEGNDEICDDDDDDLENRNDCDEDKDKGDEDVENKSRDNNDNEDKEDCNGVIDEIIDGEDGVEEQLLDEDIEEEGDEDTDENNEDVNDDDENDDKNKNSSVNVTENDDSKSEKKREGTESNNSGSNGKAESPEGCATVADDEDECEEKNQKEFDVTDAQIEGVESPVSPIQVVGVEQRLVHSGRRKRWNSSTNNANYVQS